MRQFALCLSVGLFALALPATAQVVRDSIERKPLVIGTKIETGQIVQGSRVAGYDPDDYYLSQIGVSLTQEVVVNRRLNVKVGAGGVFYNSYPQVINSSGAGYGVKFGPGITQAQALYKFGDPDRSWGALRVGYFGYKYNPDAKNLGEYLFRAGAYPTFAVTGGWSIMDNAQAKVQGVEFSFNQLDGALKHSFLLYNERDFRPPGDFTPAYVGEYTKGPIQIGAGVSFYHYFPIKNSVTSPKGMNNPVGKNSTVFTFDNLPAINTIDPLTGDSLHYAANEHIVAGYGDIKGILAPAINPSWNSGQDADADSVIANYAPSSVDNFTFKAIKLMGRASFSIQKLMPIAMLNPEDLKIYGEIDLLGVKNYPGVYDDRTERMPIMLGVNLPTFRLLNVLSFEVEYFRNGNPDDMGSQQAKLTPAYAYNTVTEGTGQDNGGGLYNAPNPGQQDYYSVLLKDDFNNHRDDWKWTLYAVKQVTTGVSVRAQVANDHFRAQDTYFPGYWTGPSMLRTPKDWYYVVSINFGI
jgi:hypothetical protein